MKEAYHPGIFLLEEIETRKLSKKDVATDLGIKPSNLSEIFAGKRNISAALAIKLEKILGISAEYWMELQKEYDLAIANNTLNTPPQAI